MAKIVASIKIFPEDVIDPAKLKEAIEKVIPENVSIHRVDEEPIAFGLVALIVHVVMSEEGGDELDIVEAALRRAKGVSEVETLLVRRI